MKKARVVGAVIVLLGGLIAATALTWYLHHFLTRSAMEAFRFNGFISLISTQVNARNIFLLLTGASAFAALMVLLNNSRVYQSDLVTITPRIQIPKPAGQNQHGSVWFLAEKKKEDAFDTVLISKSHPTIKRLIEAGKQDKEILDGVVLSEPKLLRMDKGILKGGIVLGKKNANRKEQLYYVGEDAHTLSIGSTRCGKTRHVVLQTIGLQALAGESMVPTDPKGECYIYTNRFLKRCGYKVFALDFKDPTKSHRYNFCQPIIDAVNDDNIPKAIDYTWDLTSVLVGEAKGEKLWTNGEASIIAASLLAVVIENKNKPEYQNLTNVYYFIAEMCKPPKQGEEMAIVKYMRRLKTIDPNHPAVGLLAISEISPTRTRGSFFTSALTTLRLFTNPLIAQMTSTSDFKPEDIGKEKTAVFLILPDGKSTYYSVAALFCAQLYTLTTEFADKECGGRLPVRINFDLDEFGNFIKWPDLTTQLTAGGSRGIRFNFFVQSTSQFEEKYSKEEARTIKGNCENWIYLQTDDNETLEEISKKLGPYTTTSYSISSSQQKYQSASSSQSVNLIARQLLLADEIGRIDRPYSLVTSRNNPAIMTSPDLSQWFFNDMFGLGDKEHNRKMIMKRQAMREERPVSKPALWGIWNMYQID